MGDSSEQEKTHIIQTKSHVKIFAILQVVSLSLSKLIYSSNMDCYISETVKFLKAALSVSHHNTNQSTFSQRNYKRQQLLLF